MSGHTKLHSLGDTADHSSTTLAALNVLVSDYDVIGTNGGVFTGNITYNGKWQDLSSTAFGTSALNSTVSGAAFSNTAYGYKAGQSITSGDYNNLFGSECGTSLTTGILNSLFGFQTGTGLTSSSYDTAFGNLCLRYGISKGYNTAIGHGCFTTSGFNSDYNTAAGVTALTNLTTGRYNSGFGVQALQQMLTGDYNSAIGYNALVTTIAGTALSAFSNCTGVGYDSRASASNQVQLGNSSTTTYAYGAVQDRSDIRDKADIVDTTLGLDFIKALRPVDYKWDMRDDYFEVRTDVIQSSGGVELKTTVIPLPKDGSKKRTRYHHGFIAQEVEEIISTTGKDFGGYQNHALKGGDDVKSLGYTEFIAPLVKAVQELAQENASLKARIEALENA
jgi:hypothetical protein